MAGSRLGGFAVIAMLLCSAIALPIAWAKNEAQQFQEQTNKMSDSMNTTGQYKQEFEPAMGGGGGGQGGGGQNLQNVGYSGEYTDTNQRSGEFKKDPPPTEDNQPKDPSKGPDSQKHDQKVDGMPKEMASGMGQYMRNVSRTSSNPFPMRHDYASGGFFDGFDDLENGTSWYTRNDRGARGSGGGGGPYGDRLGAKKYYEEHGFPNSAPMTIDGTAGTGSSDGHGPMGDGPGAKMYYQNHMPGNTPKRPTNPLAMPGKYNFSGPIAPPNPAKSGMSTAIPGMETFMPLCCKKQLPCCKLQLRCCVLTEEQKKEQQQQSSGGGGGGGATFSTSAGGNMATGGSGAMAGAMTAQFGLDMAMAAAGTMHQSKSNGSQKGGSGGGSKGEGGIEEMNESFAMMMDYLINVANENAGSPTSATSVSKTYANAVWMVQQMYKNVYLQIAILLILPGAILTNIKSMVGFNFLNLKDEDTLSPFTGIQRSIIAVFLIPATQLFVSYVIDTANALSSAVAQNVSVSTIELWAKEQVQTFEQGQQGEMIKNLPIVPRAPWRGKAASMPKMLGLLEQMSYCDISLCEAINQCVMTLCIAAIVFNVFQITFMCYLYLMGPICAAFFAWPGVGRELFRKAFSSWMDGVVILALWKFWWDIVLLCWGVWIENGHGNPYELVNGYYCIGWLCLLMFVPFNPFDFKVGEIVSTVLSKAEGAASAGAKKGAQGAKKGGGPGGPGPGPGPG